MPFLKPLSLTALLTAGLILSASPTPAQPARKDVLPAVSYAEVGKQVRALTGKVVVVYFWADY